MRQYCYCVDVLEVCFYKLMLKRAKEESWLLGGKAIYHLRTKYAISVHSSHNEVKDVASIQNKAANLNFKFDRWYQVLKDYLYMLLRKLIVKLHYKNIKVCGKKCVH